MARPKITTPLTHNEERALHENHRITRPPDEGRGSPSRAHANRDDSQKLRHSKKPGGTVPKHGGRTKG